MTALARFEHYIHEREEVRIRKDGGEPWPWTTDPILQTYKFTNVRRAHDRTTKTFAKIYANHSRAPNRLALYNCALFRYFGTEVFAQECGWMGGHDPAWVEFVVSALEKKKISVFTGAYVVTNGGRSEPKSVVVMDYLKTLFSEGDSVINAAHENDSWKTGCDALRRLDGFGGTGFMAKEVMLDYMIWLESGGHKPFKDSSSYTPVGPGARRGLNRLKSRPLLHRQSDKLWLVEVTALVDVLQPKWYLWYPHEPELSAHDIQFCLCEFDKYERTRLGEGKPRSKYRRPK